MTERLNSNSLLLTLFCVPSLFFLNSLSRRLSILLVFIKNYLIYFLIFSAGCVFSIPLFLLLDFYFLAYPSFECNLVFKIFTSLIWSLAQQSGRVLQASIKLWQLTCRVRKISVLSQILTILLPYYAFNICRNFSDITSFTADISNFVFFHCLVLIDIYQLLLTF